MRVLYLANGPAPYRVDFFNELGKKCELTVAFERIAASDRRWKYDVNQTMFFRAVFLNGVYTSADTAFCPSVTKLLKQNLFDIFVVGGYSTPTGILSIATLKRRKIPFVINSDGGFPKNDSWLSGKIKRSLISAANWWLSSGTKCTDYLLYYGAEKTKVFEYPFTSITYADLKLPPLTMERKLSLKRKYALKDLVILAVGQFIHRKGFDILLDVWSKIETKNACLIIIGSGPESRFYQEIISNNQLKNVTLIDFLEKQRLCEFYQLSDLFVFPTRYDIWGLVLNEALAFGLPVISSKQAASSWDLVVDEKNGFMVDISRQEELTCRLQSLLDNPELLKIYSQNSLDMIQNYTIENMAQRHMDIFEEIVMQSKFNTGREKNI